MPKNVGGAGGFYEGGVKRAYSMGGYTWLWLMDDDAEPAPNALEKLLEALDSLNLEEISAIASSVVEYNKINLYTRGGYLDFDNPFPLIQKPAPYEVYKHKVSEIDFASFVGILIHRDAISKIGFPKKEFFIYHDDVEYCIRLKQVGKIYLVPPGSVIKHKGL
ncbi:glycosyltransferase [Thermococcus peptonophilus]|uniref:glycosyltransferase n=1 Tax=Thermococcus peptonophilus TaxID=53952 RepID=UPI003466C55E